MIQRMAPVVALIPLIVVSTTIAINPDPSSDTNGPPLIVPRLGHGNSVFLHRDMKTYSYKLSASRSMSDADAARVLGRTPFLNEAWAVLETGNQQWDNGDHASAVARWRSVVQNYRGTDAALAALSHIAQFDRIRGDKRDAIHTLVDLVEQSDPARNPVKSFLVYDSYKHDACVELSDLSIETNDLRSALKYADLALTKYMFSSPCGTAAISTNWALQQRIEALRQAITRRRPVRLKTSNE